MKIVGILNESKENKMKLALCYLIEIICDYSFNDNLKLKYADGLNTIFSQLLTDTEIEVRVQGLKAMTIFLSTINDESSLNKFSSHFPVIISKCIEAVKEDGEAGKTAISSLVELLSMHPKFIKPLLNDLLVLFTEIVECKGLNEGLRIQSLGGLELLCSENEAAMR